MKFKKIVGAGLILLVSSLSFAETLTFESDNVFMGYNALYPNLDLHNVSDVKISVERTIDDNGFDIEFDLKKVEIKFPNANNLKVQGFEKLEGSPDTYRAVVTSPWIYKKLLVEVRAFDFMQDQNIDIQIFVAENTSSINNIAQVSGMNLLSGNLRLVDTSPKKVVDLLRTNYLGKALTLRLFDKTFLDTAQIQATWMGYGTQILTFNVPIYPNMKPVGLFVEPQGDDQRIRIRLTDTKGVIDSPDESLRFLLEEKFGPLPYPESIM